MCRHWVWCAKYIESIYYGAVWEKQVFLKRTKRAIYAVTIERSIDQFRHMGNTQIAQFVENKSRLNIYMCVWTHLVCTWVMRRFSVFSAVYVLLNTVNRNWSSKTTRITSLPSNSSCCAYQGRYIGYCSLWWFCIECP